MRVTRGALVAHRYTYAQPRSTAVLLFVSRCPSGTILLTPFSMVWDWLVSRAGPMLLYWPKLLYPYYSLLLFSPLFFLSIGWYCGAGVFELIRCTSLSISLALPTFFNNNNNRSSSGICLIELRFQLFIAFPERKKKVPFSMATGNGELVQECFPKHLRMGTARMK